MAYAERSTTAGYRDNSMQMPVVEYHDRVRWGPIFAGIVVSITAQLLFSALGASIGLTAGATGAEVGAVSLGVGVWAIISLFVSLFLGSYVMASACGPMNNKTALLNAVILWSTTLVISAWLLASGVSGTFGVVAANSGEVINQVQQPGGLALPDGGDVPNVSADAAQNVAANIAKGAWSFLFGSLLGLVAAMIGATVGSRKPRTTG